MKSMVELDFAAGKSPTISAEETFSLKTALDKTLKIGAEFEWNLSKETSGSCRGDSPLCPCTNHHNKEDGRVCYDHCELEATCEIRKKNNECDENCVNFISPCVKCTEFKKDCSVCKYRWNPLKDPAEIRKALKNELEPTGSTNFGKYGVYAVKDDGSLINGGVEIPTVGRRPNYYAFLKQFRFLNELATKYSAYHNERTSIHFHILTAYNGSGSELEEPIPGIFLNNFHQIVRIFHNALVWLSSGGSAWESLTRWAQFRQPIITISGSRHSTSSLVQAMKEKYKFLSYRHCSCNNDESLNRFHVEARFCDGLGTPTAVAALAMLLYAIAMKAADCSEHGILIMPKAFYDEQQKISSKLMNGFDGYGGSRHSNTEGIKDYVDTLQELSLQLLDFVKPYLMKCPEAIKVLSSLAVKPCSLRRIDNQEWADIENDLAVIGSRQPTEEADREIVKLIDLSFISAANPEEWMTMVAARTGKKREIIQNSIRVLSETKRIEWSQPDSAYIRIA